MDMINIDDKFKFNNGDVIIIGCSSGPDSMALTDMLLKVREKYNLFNEVYRKNRRKNCLFKKLADLFCI